jgi:hypothetical protein
MTDTLQNLHAQLDAARQDVALLQRLMSAEDRVKNLTAEYDKAKTAHEKAEAAKAKAANEAQFAGLRNLKITELPGDSSSVMHSTFHITYTRDAWDGRDTVPQTVSCTRGFGALGRNVLAWIIQRHPEKIPASITDLAPDIDAAFNRYFVGLQRGYLAG